LFSMAYRFTGTRILSKRAGEGLIVVVEGTNKLMARDPMFFGSSISIPRRLRRTGGIWPEE